MILLLYITPFPQISSPPPSKLSLRDKLIISGLIRTCNVAFFFFDNKLGFSFSQVFQTVCITQLASSLRAKSARTSQIFKWKERIDRRRNGYTVYRENCIQCVTRPDFLRTRDLLRRCKFSVFFFFFFFLPIFLLLPPPLFLTRLTSYRSVWYFRKRE